MRTAELLNQPLMIKNDRNALIRLKNMSQQIEHRKPTLSCGIFIVNWKFMFSMICGIFNLAIVLIQFYDVKT
ncbi:CLUMA_CG016090, isoform A [Clunio marinus]|uniref:CLUMA_CG016090, isoform A n=1 Tax=Clunio marinus TaxID=568069 RepID=A0A1J1ISK1_9DIPT|nr:CLUMA_CG016090, isoform A [Clunio marinus]